MAAVTGVPMRYDAIRQHVLDHFRGMLGRFTEGVSNAGPVDERRLASLRVAQDFADNTADGWAATVHQDGGDGLLRDFCVLRGIPEGDLSASNRALLLDALRQSEKKDTCRRQVEKGASEKQGYCRSAFLSSPPGDL